MPGDLDAGLQARVGNGPKHIIIDTDPGVDDVLAMLLAFSSKADELCVRLISVTYGNVEVEKCLRNVVVLFNQIDREMQWRKQRGLNEGYEALRAFKPLVAAGATKPLGEQGMMADYFHGLDGLGGSFTTHPHFHPEDTWRDMFQEQSTAATKSASSAPGSSGSALFTPVFKPAHQAILDVLRDSPPNTVSIVAVGPLTNLALAAAEDPETLLRAKEVVIMGGAVDVPGNISPLAEFNIYADPTAAAYLLSLTSLHPITTVPPTSESHLPNPPKLSKRLKLIMYSLDTTTLHNLHVSTYNSILSPLLEDSKPSPMVEWLNSFLLPIFQKLSTLYAEGAPLSLHDPLCIWHFLAKDPPMKIKSKAVDLRVEWGGQWCRGYCVTDRRSVDEEEIEDTNTTNSFGKRERGDEIDIEEEKAVKQKKIEHLEEQMEEETEDVMLGGVDELELVPGDHGGWRTKGAGNRVYLADPKFDAWKETFGAEMLNRILGLKKW